MAAVVNVPHILNDHNGLSSNSNNLYCNTGDDNNNNNTEVTEVPCLLTGKKSGRLKPENVNEEGSERVESQTKESIKKEEGSTVTWHKSMKLQSGGLLNNNNNEGKSHIKTNTTCQYQLHKSSVFQKWAAIYRNRKRPLARSQLTDDKEDRQDSSRYTKKASVRGEESIREKKRSSSCHSAKQQDNRENLTTLTRLPSIGLPKELISDKDFSKVDTHAINTGKELKSKKVFSAQAIAQAITVETSSDLERLRAIWIWLCHNIEYDVSGYLGLSKMVHTPEEVIKTGRGVCSGYSSVCSQLCREVGIECREVSGYGKGMGYNLGQSYRNKDPDHSWNAVRLEGLWYLLDACWGAGKVNMDSKAFNKRYDEFYFLTEPDELINTHFPTEEEWQLLERPIKLEEFETMVKKSSHFYRLGLKLIHPKHFSFATDKGEASISVGLSQPVDFTYTISQYSGSEQKELSQSRGLMTVTHSSMKLRVLPPTAGTFEVTLFARPEDTSGGCNWICSFLLECPEPKLVEILPENPHLSWGVQKNAEAMGVQSCVYGSDVIDLKLGKFEIVLQTSRPLMMFCELTHKDLDKTLSVRCLATQIEADKLTCHVLCPYVGYYRLSIFVRDYESTGDSYQNAANFLFHCTGNPINLNELFPPNLSYCCGPGTNTTKAGLTRFSHKGAIVSTQQGKCNITFQNQHDLELHAFLTKDHHKVPTYPLSRYIFFTHNGNKVTLSTALPEPGNYKLGLYGKTTSSKCLQQLCDFIIQNSSECSWPPFPFPYTSWQKGCVLLEPRSGLLNPLSWVQFQVKVPNVYSVTVCAEQAVDLKLNKSQVWEGEVFTGTMDKVQLAATQEENTRHMDILMYFDVLPSQTKL
ncbi:LOW QUALITY PROTEIN: kyphoscoliosis peptidase-like [Hoplias malabaricus]|uniref:LOW QUALITY PROTEIN: kyphoscoliosis peptidase-like n=1 Tax=Hoplias malabaricus TaxID=27720 RepID=UPI003461E831